MQRLTLYDKLFDSHVVRTEADGTSLLYIDRHLVHEVTSPQAFEGLRLAGREVRRTDLRGKREPCRLIGRPGRVELMHPAQHRVTLEPR